MRYDITRAAICMSVTELCARATLGGDLDLRIGKRHSLSPERALLGTKIHQKLQAEAAQSGIAYASEVPLFCAVHFGDLTFEVEGRADGIFYTTPLTVQEIKTLAGKQFPYAPPPSYDAQLKCYAYFLCRREGLERVCTRLTYYRLEDGDCRHYDKEYTRAELEAFYSSLLARMEFDARFLIERANVRLPSARDGKFPYSTVRDGQELLLKECYRDIRAGKRLFAQAPTGIGKTLSTLYPAVRALGEGHCDKIFYLTAKASTRKEAFRAARQIFLSGAQMNTIVLTSREQICVNAAARADAGGITGHCNPMDCPYAKGFFDRCEPAVREALSLQHGFSRSAVLELAEKYRICPYEFELMLSEYCDVIICDYNYAFDPQAYLRRYFEADALKENKYVFLVDEAHNLADRARDMYSAQLSNLALSELFWQLTEGEGALKKSLEALAITMQGFRKLCRDTVTTGSDGVERGYYLSRQGMLSFHVEVALARKQLETWLKSNHGSAIESAVLSLSGTLKRFEVISEYYDECFLTFVELEGDCITVRLICLDPSRILNACLSRAHAAVLFSATLTPTDYFADVLGGGKQAVCIDLPSPFPREHFCPIAVTSVDTRFEARARSYAKIASLIAGCLSAKRGNYIVYFPSYDYMEQVAKSFSEKYPKVATTVQSREMRQSERERFLDFFRADACLRVGFCVLGGSFSEGVDLPGDRLIGSIIVGTGLPGISNERNILKEYYDITRERGYDYAYLYPGMNRVLQAAGRDIRREEDRGIVVLIDDRYATEQYRMLLPEHWSHLQYARNPRELAEIASDFWHNFDKKD